MTIFSFSPKPGGGHIGFPWFQDFPPPEDPLGLFSVTEDIFRNQNRLFAFVAICGRLSDILPVLFPPPPLLSHASLAVCCVFALIRALTTYTKKQQHLVPLAPVFHVCCPSSPLVFTHTDPLHSSGWYPPPSCPFHFFPHTVTFLCLSVLLWSS